MRPIFLTLAALGLGALLVSGCRDAAKTPFSSDLGSFADGSWELRVDRAWDGFSGTIAFPSDPFTEADYRPDSGGVTYLVVVSGGTTTVAIGNPPVEGSRVTATDQRLAYDLNRGTFAGGRFIVWPGSAGLQAELTIYGSGRPIIKSERGNLVQQE